MISTPHMNFFRTGNVGFADIVPLRNLLADARFRRGGRNCVNLTQFLRGGFLGSSRVLVVAVSTGLPMLHTVLLSNEELLLLREPTLITDAFALGYPRLDVDRFPDGLSPRCFARINFVLPAGR